MQRFAFPSAMAALVLALGATLSAQAPYALDVAKDQSNFTWSGTTNLGPILGNPSNRFQVEGILDVVLDPAGGPFTTGQFDGGFAFTVPKLLSGRIPNPIPFLPPLATVDIVDAALRVDSVAFPIDPVTGSFSTIVEITMLHGTSIVRPLGGSPTSTPLAGEVSDPTPVTGVLGLNGSLIQLNMPIQATFDLSDPAAGFTAMVDLNGRLVAGHDLASPPAVLRVGALMAGVPGSFQVTGGNPSSPLFLAYSLSGPGSTPVASLGIVLDLARPSQAGPAVQTDPNGSASWTLAPPAGSSGITIWFQAAQSGRTTNVQVTTIQ